MLEIQARQRMWMYAWRAMASFQKSLGHLVKNLISKTIMPVLAIGMIETRASSAM